MRAHCFPGREAPASSPQDELRRLETALQIPEEPVLGRCRLQMGCGRGAVCPSPEHRACEGSLSRDTADCRRPPR